MKIFNLRLSNLITEVFFDSVNLFCLLTEFSFMAAVSKYINIQVENRYRNKIFVYLPMLNFT